MSNPEIGTFNSNPELGEELDDTRVSMTRHDIALLLRTAYAQDSDNFDLDEWYTILKVRLDEPSFSEASDVMFKFLVYLAGNTPFEGIK